MRDSATQKQSILVISDFPDVVQGDLATQLGLDGTDGVDAEIRTLRLGEMEGNASSDIFYAGY
ncbi:MAG TPA: hypothetical protein DD856_07590, partial [Sulfobacillus sp.]|nr:hypothetical protein [Sulfobacillus sp.]